MAKNKNIQKAERESLNIKDKLLEAIKASTPEVFAEGKINWDKLRQALGEHLESAVEKFNFTWAGKASAITNVLIPSKATLRPDKKESIKFDASENLFIEGDNLEVLKLLQKSYFEKIKMIYIDPPYNTGNDFVYKDNFRQPLKNYLEQSGQADSEGNHLFTNTQASGRFHSDWLTMMYPRLKLAWNLLRHDGVIFVSIDDKEVHHLRMVMNEIFGEENYKGTVVRATGQTTGQDSGGLGLSFDYVMVYSKDPETELAGLPLNEDDLERYEEKDEKDNYALWQLRKTGSHDRREDRPNMYFAIHDPDGKQIFPIGPDGYESCWRFDKKGYEKLLRENYIVWKKRKKNGHEEWWPYVKTYLEGRTKRPSPLWTDLEGSKKASIDLRDIMKKKIFDNPKPVPMISRLLQIMPISNDDDEVVLDFFAGSGTTAHAVLEQNQENSRNRKFIMVQMPEPTNPKSEAYKAGYKTIAEIAKERIRRVIKGYGDHKPINDGFKVFKLGPSNYYDNLFEYDPEKSAEENDKAFKDYLNKAQKELFPAKVNEADIIYENVIKEGLSLNARIEEIKIGKNKAYKVADGERELFICLDEKLSDSTVDSLADKNYKEKIFVCFDVALNDSDKANLALNLTLKTI